MAETAAPAKKFSFFSSRADRRKHAKMLFIILVLAACCAASGYIYQNTMRVLEERNEALVNTVALPDAASIKEAKELGETGREFVLVSRSYNSVMQTALLAEISGRFPVATPGALADYADELMGKPEEDVYVPLDDELVPPSVEVVAVMISGADRIAMINVLGEDTSLVVRTGARFSSGTAQITKINEEGVTFTWMGKTYSVGL